MNKISSIFFLMCCNVSFAQIDNITYQPDSIYKVNHVKARRVYNPDKSLNATNFYDAEGRLIRIRYERWLHGAQLTSYYIYNESGMLIDKVDTILNQEPIRHDLKKEDRDFLNSLLKKPAIEVSHYTLSYGQKLLTITQYNHDGSLDIIDSLKDEKIKIRHWYHRGRLMERSVTEYLSSGYPARSYGWQLMGEEKRTWNTYSSYQFENNRVLTITTQEEAKPASAPSRFVYNNQGLLIRIGDTSFYRFEYDYN